MEVKCILAGMLVGDKWLKYLEADRRVYDSYGLCPTVRTVTGGNKELKVLVHIDK